MPRRIACRYGKNGYFGLCGCPACTKPRQPTPDEIDNMTVDQLNAYLVSEGFDLTALQASCDRLRARLVARLNAKP